MEQLNIEGKRSGKGFVAHKAMLVSALSRAIADRVTLNDHTLGRRGLLGYLKALGGSNIVKVIPSDGKLKVTCGVNISYLEGGLWIREPSEKSKGGTPMTFCKVRVCPANTVVPNIGASELAEALTRVLPFTAEDENRPIIGCVKFEAGDGKLRLISADGFRLAVVTLDYEGDGQALVSRDNLKGVANALKRARRARVSFEPSGETLDGANLVIDTEIVSYKWTSVNGEFPKWQELIPTEFNTLAHFDTLEAIKAVSSLKVIANAKAYPIDLTIGSGKLVMADPDDKGQADIPADTEGESFVRIDGGYLAQALKACGGMADFKMSRPVAPTLFTVNGYQLVVMPMITEKATEWQKQQQAEAKAKEGKPSKAKQQAEAR